MASMVGESMVGMETESFIPLMSFCFGEERGKKIPVNRIPRISSQRLLAGGEGGVGVECFHDERGDFTGRGVEGKSVRALRQERVQRLDIAAEKRHPVQRSFDDPQTKGVLSGREQKRSAE